MNKNSAHFFLNTKGFSLIEIIIVIAIVAIGTAIAVPNYLTYRNKSKLREAANVLKGDLYRAKITAIKNHTSITVQFSANSYTITSLGTKEMPAGTTIDLANTTLNANNTTFNSKGIPNSGINDTGRVVLNSLDPNHIKRITIGSIGQVTLETSVDGGSTWG